MELTRGRYYNLTLDHAEVLPFLGRAAEAEQPLRVGVDQHPDIGRGYHALASSLIDQGRFEEAFAPVDEGRSRSRVGPGTVAAFAHRAALALEGLGRPDSALVRQPGLNEASALSGVAERLHMARLHLVAGGTAGAEETLAHVEIAYVGGEGVPGTGVALRPCYAYLLKAWRYEK